MTPEEVRLTPFALELCWADRIQSLGVDTLRRTCRCADCLAHGTGPIPEALRLTGAEAVGRYALQLKFSDGHERGIYPWSYLAGLGMESHIGQSA